MSNKSSDNSNEKLSSQPLKIEKKNVVCKDGFCSITNQNENPKLNKRNINLFDPI